MKRLLLLSAFCFPLSTFSPAATVTGYCACRKCCGEHAAGLAATGRRPVAGVTVAGPRHVALGTRVRIAGLGWRTVQDRTARRYDGRWDVYFSDHETARRFGKRSLAVTFN